MSLIYDTLSNHPQLFIDAIIARLSPFATQIPKSQQLIRGKNNAVIQAPPPVIVSSLCNVNDDMDAVIDVLLTMIDLYEGSQLYIYDVAFSRSFISDELKVGIRGVIV